MQRPAVAQEIGVVLEADVAGVRVDHVDGLADPLTYLRRLRETIGDRWLVVEKILAADETLPAAWPVDGTTGYEHATVLEHALLDHDGWSLIRDSWVDTTGDGRPFRAWELAARREVLDAGLRPDLDRVARAATGALGVPAAGDVTDEVAVQATVRRALEATGCINGVVNVAGIARDARIIKKSYDEFKKTS